MAGSVVIERFEYNHLIRNNFIRFMNDEQYCKGRLEIFQESIRAITNYAYQTSDGTLIGPRQMSRIFKVDIEGCHAYDYINLFSGCYSIPIYVTRAEDRFMQVCRKVIDNGLVVFLKDPYLDSNPPTEDISTLFKEGEAKYKRVTVYERNSKNRNRAIEIHGTSCKVCGMSFSEKYGEHGAGFIEVHHIVPLHLYDESKPIDPETDLTVLCSNCHKMIHRYKLNYLSVNGLKGLIELNNTNLKSK